MTRLTVTGLRKSFGPTEVLRGLDLDVPSGALAAVLGPSGCGKTTLLRVIAGFEDADAGEVRLGDRVVAAGPRGLAPERRRVTVVPQEGALFPHLTVADNVAFGVPRRLGGRRMGLGTGRAGRRRARVEELLELVGLGGLGARMPRELSGGQQQRVAVARALAMDPQIMLMDEPFGALDEQSRRRIGIEMSHVLTEAHKTVVMVTHSLDEAIFWADRVLVMGKGPGRIVREFIVDAPRPRRLDFMTTASFDALRAELFGLLEGAPEEVVAP